MQYRNISGSDLRVSVVGFGLWTVSTSWWGITEDAVGHRLLNEAFDLGVNFYDTADTYGDGKGETILRDALGDRRDQIVIATKFGYDFYTIQEERTGQRERPQDYSPKFVRFAVEQSLKRLGTDYIDIYQMHNPRMTAIQSDELFALLETLKTEGKIRHYGAALGPAIGWEMEGLEIMRKRDIEVLQIIHNMLEQDPGRSMLATADERGVSVLTRVPHSSGLLEGKYTAETTFSEKDHRSHRPKEWLTEGLQKLEKLEFLSDGTGRTIGQAAIQWLLSHPSIVSVLPNIYDDSDQLREFAQAADVAPLTTAEVARVNELFDTNYGMPAKEPQPA